MPPCWIKTRWEPGGVSKVTIGQTRKMWRKILVSLRTGDLRTRKLLDVIYLAVNSTRLIDSGSWTSHGQLRTTTGHVCVMLLCHSVVPNSLQEAALMRICQKVGWVKCRDFRGVSSGRRTSAVTPRFSIGNRRGERTWRILPPDWQNPQIVSRKQRESI